MHSCRPVKRRKVCATLAGAQARAVAPTAPFLRAESGTRTAYQPTTSSATTSARVAAARAAPMRA